MARTRSSYSAREKVVADLAQRLTELRCAADDTAELVRDLRDSLDFEPGELDELESRLDVIYRVRKKYGATVEDMLDYLARCRAELEQIEDSSETLARLEKRDAIPLAGASCALALFR